MIGDVRGKGLMQALELVKDRESKEPAPEATAQLLEVTRRNGLLIGKGGLYGNVIRLSPMLNIGKADVWMRRFVFWILRSPKFGCEFSQTGTSDRI